MAEYIRFRFNAAKAGVTMAFLALLGGVAARADAESPHHGLATRDVKTISWFPKLTLNGISGNLRTSLISIQKDLQSVYYKEQKDIAAVYYKEQKVVGSAIGKVYAKLDQAFYNKDQANALFLTQSDAGKVYAKLNGTIANADKLGGLGAIDFIQGQGGVASGMATATAAGGAMPLVSAADGSVTVKAEITPGAGPTLEIANNTSGAFDWVATIGGNITDGTLSGNTTTNLPLPGANKVSQATVQLIPAVAKDAITLTVSTEPASGPSGGQMFIGQMLIGLL